MEQYLDVEVDPKFKEYFSEIQDELPSLVASSKEMGYQYIRLDTNGQFPEGTLEHPALKDIDEITFSLDGHTPIINDPLRGAGSFEKCVGNIRRAVRLSFNVDITCCVHRGNIGKDSDGIYLIEKAIAFASSLGVWEKEFVWERLEGKWALMFKGRKLRKSFMNKNFILGF